MRTWKPRPPAARIKAALFPQPSDGPETWPGPILWQRLAPAMALFISAMLLLNNLSHSLTPGEASASARLAAAASLSDPELAAYYAAALHSGQNTWRNTFEWTNASHSLTTAAPMFKNIRPLPN